MRNLWRKYRRFAWFILNVIASYLVRSTNKLPLLLQSLREKTEKAQWQNGGAGESATHIHTSETMGAGAAARGPNCCHWKIMHVERRHRPYGELVEVPWAEYLRQRKWNSNERNDWWSDDKRTPAHLRRFGRGKEISVFVNLFLLSDTACMSLWPNSTWIDDYSNARKVHTQPRPLAAEAVNVGVRFNSAANKANLIRRLFAFSSRLRSP